MDARFQSVKGNPTEVTRTRRQASVVGKGRPRNKGFQPTSTRITMNSKPIMLDGPLRALRPLSHSPHLCHCSSEAEAEALGLGLPQLTQLRTRAASAVPLRMENRWCSKTRTLLTAVTAAGAETCLASSYGCPV